MGKTKKRKRISTISPSLLNQLKDEESKNSAKRLISSFAENEQIIDESFETPDDTSSTNEHSGSGQPHQQ